MIVKNEEENIINCLDRALKVVDEAIIVDTGSTDKTKELLGEKYGDDTRVKIIEEKWENDFSKARNKSLEYATGDWVLILDADERIFCDRGQLEAFLRNSDQPAYNIPIYNIFDKDSFTVSTSMIRLYKNNNPKYKGAIHEQLEIDGRGYLGGVIDKDICKIYHYGYSSSVFKKKNKSKRNMDIIKEEIRKNPEDPFNWYNKGVMDMIDEKYGRALDDFIKAHKLCKNVRKSFHNDLLIRMIQCIMMLNNYKQAIEFIENISKDVIMKDMPDIYYYLGICYTRLKKYDEAIENFKKAMDIGEYYNGISKFGVGSYLSMIEWAKVLELKGEKLLAIKKYREAVFNENNAGKQGLDELKRLLKEEGMEDGLDQLEKILSDNNGNSNADGIKESIIRNDEFEEYKKEVKKSIQTLIENGMIAEAKEAINGYEDIVKNDIDIYSIKGVIAMMEGNLREADKILINGLATDKANFDILYNLGYLYQTMKNNKLAIDFYKRALQNARDEDDENEVHEILKTLGAYEETVNENIKQYAGNTRKTPAITIITWAYNVEKYIKECIESVLNQSFTDFEWVILDNGCTDGTGEILKEYAQKDSRIKLFRNERNNILYHEPISADYIRYINNLKSEYVCNLDSDDYLHPDFLEELYTAAKNCNADIVLGGYESFYENDLEFRIAKKPPCFFVEDITKLGDFFPQTYGFFRPLWGKLVRMSIYTISLRYFGYNMREMLNGSDTMICLYYLRFSNCVVSVDKALYYYRVRESSQYNSQVNKNRYLDYLKIYNESYGLLKSWNKLSTGNLNFLGEVLYLSLKDCIAVAVNTENVPIEDRVEVISTILSDVDIKKTINEAGLLMNLFDDVSKGLNTIVEKHKSKSK